ncbi:hypothetical protein DRQ29_05675 [bacterium]|nr:MAG: hypothetical protein DRQ29_05675 [bacterium]
MPRGKIKKEEMEKIKKKYSKELKKYMNFNYPITIQKFDSEYIASIEELPGCEAYGKTIEEALENLRYSKENWLLLSFRKGFFPPLPKNDDRLVIRIPKELHLKLGEFANRRNISFNSFLVDILSDWINKKDLKLNLEFIGKDYGKEWEKYSFKVA